MTIGGTSLIGIFAAGHKDMLLVPSIITEEEKELLNQADIPFTIYENTITALGNTIITDENHTLLSQDFSQLSFFQDALHTDVMTGTIGNLGTIGSLAVIGNNSILVPPIITAGEKATLKKHFKKEIIETLLQQSPYLHASILKNSNGAVISKGVSGDELFIVQDFLHE